MSIQMVCPYCKKEFPYENEEVDHEIAENAIAITKIDSRLREIKGAPVFTKELRYEKTRLLQKRSEISNRQSELKAYRKQAGTMIERMQYDAFKSIIRERYGEKEFHDILNLVEESISAYSIKSTMSQGYSRSPHLSNVTNINKL